MTDPILAAFVVLIILLFATAASPERFRGKTGHVCTLLSAAGVLLALIASLVDAPPSFLQLPLGLPGQAIQVALDPLSVAMLLLLFVAGTPVAAFAAAASRASRAPSSVPVVLAALALAVLAAETVLMAAGVAIAALGVWAGMMPGRHRAVTLGALLASAGGLFVAISLIASADPDGLSVRSTLTGQGQALADAAFLCALGAVGSLAGLAPLHRWLPRAAAQTSPETSALLCGALAPLAIGLLARFALDADLAPPTWWAWILLLVGGATTATAGWRAATAAETDAAVVASIQRIIGLMVIDLGLASLGRTMDLPELAAMALAGMLIWAAVIAVCGPLAILAAAVLQDGAGSRRLDRMGGLFHFMPVSSVGLLAGLAGMAAIPPAAGFAGVYLTFQAVLSAPRLPDLVPSLLVAASVAVQGLGMALGVAGAVRTFGIACLGRPRTPRAAAATEAPRSARIILTALAGMTILLGLFPGVVLNVIGGSAVGQLAGLTFGDRAGLLYMSGGVGSSHYAPLPLAALLGMCGGMMLWLKRQDTRSGSDAVPVWQDGFPSTASWMPFGDPLTQSDGIGFVPPGLPAWSLPSLPKLPRLGAPRLRLGRERAPLALLVLLAAALAILGGGGG